MPKTKRPKIKIVSTRGTPRYVVSANKKILKGFNSRKRAESFLKSKKKTGLVR